MPLMDRIKAEPFLDLTHGEQLALIRDLQLLRKQKIKEEALKPKRKTRKRKPAKKRKRKVSAAKAKSDALNALAKLTPEQILALTKELT